MNMLLTISKSEKMYLKTITAGIKKNSKHFPLSLSDISLIISDNLFLILKKLRTDLFVRHHK